MKLLLETTGNFQLVDYGQDSLVIRHDRPSVAAPSHFISSRCANGQAKVLGNVNDQATDAEFQKYLKDSDGDVELAISAFSSAFPAEEGTEPVTKPKSKGKAKA